MKTLALFLVLGVACHALAKDGAGNGGDPVALEFTQEAQVAISLVKNNQNQFPEIADATKLSNILDSAGIYVVNQPCEIEKNQITQTPAACNNPVKQTISIYRDGWNRESDRCVKRGVALHEVLGLAKIESTGDYHLSQKLVVVCMASDHSAQRDAVVTTIKTFAEDEMPYLGLASVNSQPSGNWISGPAVTDQEKQRLNSFKDAAAGFRELPYGYQLDMLATGVAAYTPYKLSRGTTIYEAAELGVFYPMTQWLASDLNTYVKHVDYMLSLYKEKAYAKFSSSGKKKLDELLSKSKRLVEVVDHESHDGGQYYKKLIYTVPTNPYSDYLKAMVNQMRKYVAQNGCVVPTTFKLWFNDKKAKANINNSLSQPDLDLEDARVKAEKAGDDFRALLVGVSDEWAALTKAENLDKITFNDSIPLGSSHIASSTYWIMNTAFVIFNATKEQFDADSKVLPEMLLKLESGSLCIK